MPAAAPVPVATVVPDVQGSRGHSEEPKVLVVGIESSKLPSPNLVLKPQQTTRVQHNFPENFATHSDSHRSSTSMERMNPVRNITGCGSNSMTIRTI
uniref:Uncharacterized protein n=1 Tax=Lutzomyia longipalpis TaxID=7200 RepID=A0A1B0CE00_LUTLO